MSIDQIFLTIWHCGKGSLGAFLLAAFIIASTLIVLRVKGGFNAQGFDIKYFATMLLTFGSLAMAYAVFQVTVQTVQTYRVVSMTNESQVEAIGVTKHLGIMYVEFKSKPTTKQITVLGETFEVVTEDTKTQRIPLQTVEYLEAKGILSKHEETTDH